MLMMYFGCKNFVGLINRNYSIYGLPVVLFFTIYKLFKPITWENCKSFKDFPFLL